jgi:hypothetical protein
VNVASAQQTAEGMIVVLRIDKWCTEPGTCQGFVGIGKPGAATTVRVEAGTTTIRKGGQDVILQELRLGDQASAQCDVKYEGNVGKLIEVK